jgi:hypothetical protein
MTFEGRDGQVVLDQLRTVDKTRLVRRLGRIDTATQENVLASLAEMFAEQVRGEQLNMSSPGAGTTGRIDGIVP